MTKSPRKAQIESTDSEPYRAWNCCARSLRPQDVCATVLGFFLASCGTVVSVAAQSKILPIMRAPVVVDVESTGFGRSDRIIEIALITLDPATWETVDEYDTLINPARDVGPTGVHGITASMVEAAPTFTEIIGAVAMRLNGSVLVAHNLAFDARMLHYEFQRCGVAIDLGEGHCTYRATSKKLIRACEDCEIPLSQHHRALADARATAELGRRLHLARTGSCTMAVTISDPPRTVAHPTLRRGLVDTYASPMHRVVSRASYPNCDRSIQEYLDMLDWVLDDGVIDATEQLEIRRLARDLRISDKDRADAHRAYLNCIISAARRDGVISVAEHELIVRIATQLEVHDVAIPKQSFVSPVNTIRQGTRICFSGGASGSKDRLMAIAERAGFVPVLSVTKKGCDLLVAADVATSSSKAKSARKWGIPILSAQDFVERCGSD